MIHVYCLLMTVCLHCRCVNSGVWLACYRCSLDCSYTDCWQLAHLLLPPWFVFFRLFFDCAEVELVWVKMYGHEYTRHFCFITPGTDMLTCANGSQVMTVSHCRYMMMMIVIIVITFCRINHRGLGHTLHHLLWFFACWSCPTQNTSCHQWSKVYDC